MPNPFMTTLAGTSGGTPPIWLMRQAGRYLPEYREVRNSEPDFISFCLNPEKAVEVTLQPIRKFDFDAAIIFSDILMVPWAMDRNVRFVPGTGPVLDALERFDDIDPAALGHQWRTVCSRLAEAISLCRARLHDDKALIGFAGAPWTVITYMLEGGSSRDFATARGWMWQNDGQFDALLELVTEATVEFLAMQAAAGADVLMLFDSWASAVPAEFRRKVVIDPVNRIIDRFAAAGSWRQSSDFQRASAKGLSPTARKPTLPGSDSTMASILSGRRQICRHMLRCREISIL